MKYFALILLILSFNSFGSICDDHQDFEKIAVLNKGRVKPYFVAAKEFTKAITSKSKISNIDTNKLFCLVSMNDYESIKAQINIKVEHFELKKFLGLADSDLFINIEQALEKKELVRSEIMGQKENNSYKKALNKFWFKANTFEKATKGELWTVYQKSDKQSEQKYTWQPISNFKEISTPQLLEENSYFKKNNENTIDIETTYAKSNIFTYAMLIALIAIILTVMRKSASIGFAAGWILIITEAIGMTFRVLISGRAPITNMYETVLFSGFGALFIALIIYIFKRDKLFILGGLGYNILCLFMMRFADGMLSESISPLVPVLRDNFWLSTHVTTIILSYAALALSWMLANMTLIKGRFGTLSSKDLRYYEDLIYTAIKVGIVLLAAGIILGGVWADYSWGRFWGWDPKETWSLIVLLFYMAILHGKSTPWVNTRRFINLSAAGFMTVMMAWFGVNYILATGLHSYGFSEGGAIFLGVFFISQIVLIILANIKVKTRA